MIYIFLFLVVYLWIKIINKKLLNKKKNFNKTNYGIK